MIDWIFENADWIFSGTAEAVFIALLIRIRKKDRKRQISRVSGKSLIVEGTVGNIEIK